MLERKLGGSGLRRQRNCRCREAGGSRAIPKHAGVWINSETNGGSALYLFIAASAGENELEVAPLKDAALAAVRRAEGLPAGLADTEQMEAALTRQEAASLARTDSDARIAPPRSTAFGEVISYSPPQLDELPLAEATRNWPHAEEAAAISLVRFLVLLKCCGSENSERAFYDPLVRELLLIPPFLVSRSIANLAGGTQAATSAKFSDRAIEMAS